MSDDAAQKLRDAGQTRSRASRTLGMKFISADTEAMTADMEFEASDDFFNPIGSVQGGFVAAMLDDAMAIALSTTVGPGFGFPTLEMKANFIGAAPKGKILGQGRVVYRGRSTAFLEAELRAPDGKLIATGSSTARIVPMKRD